MDPYHARRHFRLRLERGVDTVVWKREQEGAVAMGLDKGHRLVGLAVSEVFPRGAVRQRGNPVRRKVARRLTLGGAATVHIEALMLGAMLVTAEMPLADRRGGVASGRKPLRDRYRLERQVLCPVSRSPAIEPSWTRGLSAVRPTPYGIGLVQKDTHESSVIGSRLPSYYLNLASGWVSDQAADRGETHGVHDHGNRAMDGGGGRSPRDGWNRGRRRW